MNKIIKSLLTELASACAATQPELSAQALSIVNDADKIITEITDDTTVGQIEDWMRAKSSIAKEVKIGFSINLWPCRKNTERAVDLFDTDLDTMVLSETKDATIADAEKVLEDYDPEIAKVREIAEIEAKLARLKGKADA